MKKFFWCFSILSALFFSLYTARHFFIGTALEFGLQRLTGESVAYHTRHWEDDRLIYEDFSLGQQLYAQEAAFDFELHLFPFSIHSFVHLTSPTIQIENGETQANLAFLLPAKFWTVKLDIEQGSLISSDKEICHFDFTSGLAPEEIGTLTVYQDDAASLFTCGFNYRAGSLAADFQMEEASLEKVLPLASLFYPLPSWKLQEGTISAALKGTLDINELTFLQGHFSLQNIRLESDDLIFAVDKAASRIDFQGEIETFALDTDFNGVDLFWKELEVLRGEGAIVFKPKEIPTFEAHAAVHVADLEGRADLVGKGEIHDHQSLWLEGTLDYVTAQNPLKVDFSWADDGKSQVLQTHIRNLGQEILALLNTRFPAWNIKHGRIDGQATAFLDQGIFNRLQLDNIEIHQLAVDNLSIQEIELQGSLNLLSGDVEQLRVQTHDAAGEYKGWKVASVEGTISIQDNNFEPSSAFGKFEGVPFALQFEGPLSSLHASAKLSAGASEWLKLPKNGEEPPILLELVMDRKQQELQIKGTATCLDDVIQLHALVKENAAWKGDFQTSLLQSSFYTPFLKIFASALTMQGDLSLRGQFSEESIDILAQSDDLAVVSPEFRLSIPGQSREFFYHFDFKEKQGSGKFQLSPLLLTSQQLPLSITRGEVVFDNTSLTCHEMAGQIKGIEIAGDLTANWEDKFEASFLAQNIQGSVEDLLKITAPFYQAPFELKGRFSSPPEGLQLHYAEGKYHYRFHSLFEKIQGPLTPKLYLENTSFNVAYDSLENRLTLQNIEGSLSEKITFVAHQIDYKNGEWNFDAAFDQGERALLSLQGKALETTNGYQVTLQEGKASASYLKSPLSFEWTPPSKMDKVRGLVYIDTKNLVEQLNLLDQLGLFELSPSVKETLDHLQGCMTLRLMIDADRSEYELQGSHVGYASSLFDSVEAHLIRQRNTWSLKCSLDDIEIKGEAAGHPAKWIVSGCDIGWKDLHLHTSGVYEKDKFDFKINGQLSSFSLKGTGIFFSSTPQFQNLSLQIEKVASLSCETLKYRAGKWESPALDVIVFSKDLIKPLRTQLQVSLSPQSITFQGAVSQGEIQLGKGALKITQIYGLYEAPYLHFKCGAALGDEPLHFLGKLSKDHHFGGGLNIQRGKELLKLSLSDPTTCQKAEGELFGLSVNLQRESQGYKGTVLVKDGSKLTSLTEDLQDFSGLQLSGLFTKINKDWTFKGELEGHDARLKDYLVQELHATVDYTPHRFQLKNLTLQDPAGSLTIKECNGFRTALDPWNVTIPLLKGQEIKPSAIRKQGGPQKEIKPLQVRYLVMTDLTGQLGDLKSFRGLGTLNFTQRVKKEPSLFDIPLALLKDLGLDLDIFSPVMGEVKLQLKGGKLIFTDLQNAFSEGKRSEFYLAKEPSYIDLNGSLFLNLRMQQNVVLKFIEPFMIAVRGTWEKPKYSLQ